MTNIIDSPRKRCKCGCLFAFEKEDVKTLDVEIKVGFMGLATTINEPRKRYYVECPQCGQRVFIDV